MEDENLNKVFNVNLTLEFNMEHQTPIISHIEIQKNPEQMTYKEKIKDFFEKELQSANATWETYKNIPEDNANISLIVEKRTSERILGKLISYLKVTELL